MKAIITNIKYQLPALNTRFKAFSTSVVSGSFNNIGKIRKSRNKLLRSDSDILEDELVSYDIPKDHEEIERYWVDEPYSFVSIIHDTILNDTKYITIEPKLNRFEKPLLEEVMMMLEDVLTLKGVEDIDEFENTDKTELLKNKTAEILSDYSKLDHRSFEKIFYYVKRDFVEFRKISTIMRDHSVEDVWCNGVGIPVYVYHSGYGDLPTNIVFETDEELDSFVMRIAQQSRRHLSKSNPILDTVMKDGSRINMTYGHDISPKGSSFSIRRQKTVPLTPLDLIAWKSFSAQMMAYFWICMENRKNILLCGGTATGKTSALNAICMFIPLNIRIVTLEDTREIQLPHKNWIPTVTRDGLSSIDTATIDLEDLLRASLRQRPEYLLVGEVRSSEAQILFQAMNAGHSTCSTFHAGTPKEVINRFTNPPINVPPAMFTALDVICMLNNTYENGSEKRKAFVVAEVTGVGTDVQMEDVFQWDITTNDFNFMGSHVMEDIRNRRGWSMEEVENILQVRTKFLLKLIENGIRDYADVVCWINAFCKDPKDTMSLLESDMSGSFHSIIREKFVLNAKDQEDEMMISPRVE
ncbi:type II/IV secretion system ATPase subunit [Methanococcoides sp. SA1]|nr:type II/IV secretion system ATPase subunit [Methanococcoides sp. SA1]